MGEISVHDNFIYAYAVHCEQRRIVLHTEFRDRPPVEHTDVIFSDVVAHHFESVLSNNILFGIEEVDPSNIVMASADLFAHQKSYGWPEGFEYGDVQELISFAQPAWRSRLRDRLLLWPRRLGARVKNGICPASYTLRAVICKCPARAAAAGSCAS